MMIYQQNTNPIRGWSDFARLSAVALTHGNSTM